jgi:hypothetical protein
MCFHDLNRNLITSACFDYDYYNLITHEQDVL